MLSRQPILDPDRSDSRPVRHAEAVAAARPALTLVPPWAGDSEALAWPRRAKRLVDLAGAGLLLALLTPLMALVAAAIRLGSRGPAVFVQQRIGRHGAPFRMYKFRTMVVGAERQEHALATMLLPRRPGGAALQRPARADGALAGERPQLAP
jgi:lipopolysaccharide/colanic/teichoic acid biosynthesis glycosyltransferase